VTGPSKRGKWVREVEDEAPVEEGSKTTLVYPFQQLVCKRRMVKIVPALNEGVLTVITASPGETFMTERQSMGHKVEWQGPYSMWKDTKEIQLALDDSAGTELVMIMPGEDESHRLFKGKRVHVPNLRACAIVDHYRGAFFLGGDVICGTVYVIERAYDDDIDYDAIEDDKTELPNVDISDDNLAMVSGVWGDDDEEDEEDDEE
jgi:hypothetical protein